MAPIFSKIAAPAMPSPLHSESPTTEHVARAHISIHGNVKPWAGGDAAHVTPHSQYIVAESQLQKPQREPSLLRLVLIRVMFLEHARAELNVVAATGTDSETGSLPAVDASGPSMEQASTQGSRKRKATEVERGSLARQKTNEWPASGIIAIEPIPRPSAPAPTDAWLHSPAALHSNAQDTVSSGADLPELTAAECDVTAMQESHGAPGDMDDYGFQIISLPPSPDQYVLPPPESSADSSMASFPIFAPIPRRGFASHFALAVNPQAPVASFPVVSSTPSHQLSSMINPVTPATILQTQRQDMATDLVEENGARVGLDETSEFDEVDLSIEEIAPVVISASDGDDLDLVFKGSSDALYNPLGPAEIPSDVGPWDEDAEDYTFQAVPSTWEVC